MNASITVKNLLALAGLIVAVAAIPGCFWWFKKDGGVEPVVAGVIAVGSLIGIVLAIDWRNLLITGREHDREIAMAFESHLPEENFVFFVGHLQTSEHFEVDGIDPVYTFLHYHPLEKNALISKKLQLRRDNLALSLRKLASFCETHFFIEGNDEESRFLDRGLKYGSREEQHRYYEYRAALGELCKSALNSYKEYRQAVKRTLLI